MSLIISQQPLQTTSFSIDDDDCSLSEDSNRGKEITAADQHRRCAKVALIHLNRNQKTTGAPEYVLVEPVISSGFFSGPSLWYHANFKARPKNDPAAEPELFFAEIKGRIWGTNDGQVIKVCVLGPNELGLHSCKACSPATLHPEGGFNAEGGGFCYLSPKPILANQGRRRSSPLYYCKGRMYDERPPGLSKIPLETMLANQGRGEIVPKKKRSRSNSTVAKEADLERH